MANKVLTVEINADTGKFEAKVKEIPKLLETQVTVSEKLKVLEADRNANLAKQKELLVNVQNTLDKVSKYSEKFQLNALNAQLPSVNRKFQEIETTIKSINAEIVKTSRIAAEISLNKGALPTAQRPVASSSQGSAYFGGTAQRVSQAVPKVDATTIKSTAPDLSYSLISGATKSAAIIKEAQKSFADRLAAVPVFKPSSDYAIQLTKGLSEAGRLASQQKQAISDIGTATENVAKQHKNIIVHIAEIIGLYRVLNSAINVTLSAIKAVPKIGIELEATVSSLSSTMGSEAGAVSALSAITKEAERTGMAVSALRTSFRTFQASTSLAGESLESTWKMFTNINTVSSALHLTVDQTNGVFLALAQIFNKTKVQSEELVKQLGNLLPGAFASFSAANRDMFKNSADLIAKMKLGVVTAHDTVEKFTTYLAGRFNTAFNIASQGLNANVGRMQTSFTLLGEAIYSTTRGPMIEFTKSVTSIVNYITEGIKGTNNFGTVLEQLATVSIAAVIGAMASLVGKFLLVKDAAAGATAASIALNRSLSFLSTPTAVIAGIALIGLELKNLHKDLKTSEEGVKDFFATLQQRKLQVSEAEKIRIEVDADPAVKGTIDALDGINKVIEEREKIVNNVSIGSFTGAGRKAIKEAQTQLKLNYAERTAIEEELENQRAIALEAIQLKNASTNAEALDAWHTKRKQLEIAAERARGNEIGAARLQAEEQYVQIVEEARKKIENPKSTTEEIAQAKKTIEDYNTVLANAGVSKQAKENAKEAKDAYKEINQAIKTMEIETKRDLENVDQAYQQNLISFSEYHERKKSILAANLESETSFARETKRIAEAAGDQPKVVESEEKLQRLQVQYSMDLTKLEAERYAAAFNNSKELTDLTIEYYNAVGRSEDAVRLQLKDKYALIEDALKKQIEAGNTAKQVDLDRIEAIKKVAIAEASVVNIRQKIAAGEAQYEQSLNRINILKNIGSISELNAARQVADLSKDKISLAEESIRTEEIILNSMEKGTAVYDAQVEKIRAAKEELEQFKLTANTVALYFENILGQAFENSFASFVTGSQTASQAFDSFANSMISSIAKIIAEELKSNMLNLLFQAGKGILGSSGLNLGSFFGGGFSGVGPLQSFANPFANGGIASGLSSASSTVLTQPTLFPGAKVIPFASGGVLAGEAGAEAVLPLKRGRNGKLGVAMEDGQQSSGGNIININVSVARSQGEDDSAYTAKIAEAIARRIAKEEVANGARTGNINNRITKFG